MCGCGAVVKATGAHHQVMGSIPIRKVYLSFLIVPPYLSAHHSLPLLLTRGTLSSLSTLSHIMHTHTRTHTYTHTHIRSPTPKPHTHTSRAIHPTHHATAS